MNTYTLPFTPSRIQPAILIAILGLFALVFGFGEGLKPRQFWSDEIGNPVYEHIIPRQFGDWTELPGRGAAVVNPVQAEMLNKIYSETVSRIYVNRQSGRVLMFSLAYGKDQSTDTQLHTPEMCYPSQGFRVESEQLHDIAMPGGQMPIKRLWTSTNQRAEPLTYFVRNGDYITTKGSLDRNLARLGVAIRGYKVDGLLVRVSEVSRRDDTFAFQDAFLRDLIAAMPPSDRFKLIGKLALERP